MRSLSTQMTDFYTTIATPSRGLYKDKGSRFLSFALPVCSVEQAMECVAGFRKEYHDARHVCYAYVLGAGRDRWRAVDDGEPSGTAGRPILGQINSRALTDVLVVVVRYFGGVLLGTGGLITAYREAASAALDAALPVERTVDEVMEVCFEYPLTNHVMRVVKDSGARVVEQVYGRDCRLQLRIRRSEVAALEGRLSKLKVVVRRLF